MSAGPLPLARRTTLTLGLAGIAGLAALSSCGEHIAGPAPMAAASSDPDTALVDSVLVALTAAEQLAGTGGFTDLVLLHQAHIEALDGTPSAPAPGHASGAAVRRSERELHDQLVEASMAAESGALARLFASMSAALSQQLAAGVR